MIKSNTKIVILAGGKGKRFNPFSFVIPKPLMPINQNPILMYLINAFKKNNFKNFFISTGYQAELIKAYYRIFHYDEKIKNNKDFITRLYFEKINTLYHLKYSKEDIENYYLKYLENDNYNKDIVFEKLNYVYKRFYNESE